MRSIPACAGEPLDDVACGIVLKVYPRVCGGACLSRSLRFYPVGLSPRVRGSQANTMTNKSSTRSIPACAGEPTDDIDDAEMTWSIPACAGEPK